MAAIKKIALVLAGLVVVLVVVAFFLPAKAHVERQTLIQAPKATVFTLVNGYKNFNKWSPWHDLDPNTQYTYSGPAQGVGTKMSWTSQNPNVGSGSQEIIESQPWDLVKTNLDFGAQGTAIAFFRLASEGEATRVIWGFDTDLGNNPVSRYFGLFFDRLIGADYEKGLAALKKLAESLPKSDFSDLQVESTDVKPISVAYVPTRTSKDQREIAAAIGAAYAQVGKLMRSLRLSQAGPPLTITTKLNDSGYEFEAAIPLDKTPEKELPGSSAVRIRQTYSGKALKAIHKGAYRNLPSSYEKLFAYAAASGFEQNGAPWEQYISDPGNTPEVELITHLYLPVK
jgi:effector-binding domain-containing protein